jgi:hypothetical protein
MKTIEEYFKFCTKSRLHKSLVTLQGIIKGVTADDEINTNEVEEIKFWVEEQKRYLKYQPYCEIIPVLENALGDGVLGNEEIADLNWFLAKASEENEFYDIVTADIQYLQGILHGILADGVIKESEVVSLSNWLEDNNHLRTTYPYDEIYSLLISVLKDGKVDKEEREFLRSVFADFVNLSGSNNYKLNSSLKFKVTTLGVCAVDPVIELKGNKFVFTGESHRFRRSELKEIVEQYGGIFGNSITKNTDFLIYGASGNQCWAYSCYGRKVEKAVDLRKAGSKLLIVHENDFFDALLDAGYKN